MGGEKWFPNSLYFDKKLTTLIQFGNQINYLNAIIFPPETDGP